MAGLLAGRSAILHGGGGRIGAVVARTFAREGATVFLTGRTRERLDAAAAGVAEVGGTAHVAVLDALDEDAVNAHAATVAGQAGGIDVAFNLVSRGDVQGTPLLDIDADDFMRPIETGARANFLTARAAARQMAARGSGVILMLTSGSGPVLKPSPSFAMGGTGPADAAQESFLHYLAAEVGPRGVRVAGLWTAGCSSPSTWRRCRCSAAGPPPSSSPTPRPSSPPTAAAGSPARS